jgi:hypothetical protein
MPSTYLGFDVEATGEYHDLLSVAFTLCAKDGTVLDQKLFVIAPNPTYVPYQRAHTIINAKEDYNWSDRCWEEFGRHHIDIINATQNSEDAIKLSYADAPKEIRKYFDYVCSEYSPLVGVDNAAFDCTYMNNLFCSDGEMPIEYQRTQDGVLAYEGITDYGSVLTYLRLHKPAECDMVRESILVPNDHNPLNDSHRHALYLSKLY